MRALLIDDEPLTFIEMKRLLEQKIGGIEVVGTCQNPAQAVAMAQELKPDVVFLDIQMPEISGLAIGEQLQAQLPDTRLIFVTAYDQYAIDAFELYAMDYLLKPVNHTRMQRTVERLRKEYGTTRAALTKRKREKSDQDVAAIPILACFGKLRLLKEEDEHRETLSFKWRTSKSQELFAYLLHHRTKLNDRETLLELLWPDFDKQRAIKQLYTAIYHIRSALKALGLQTAITINSGDLDVGYRLTLDGVAVDTERWEAQLRELPTLDSSSLGQHEDIIARYTDDFLSNCAYEWAEHERLRLLRLWLHHTMRVVDFLVEKGNLTQAAHYCRRMQLRQEHNSELIFLLMKIYSQSGDRVGVEEQYWLLRSLSEENGLEMSETMQRWYLEWQQKHPLRQ